jgi:hypothetical protein
MKKELKLIIKWEAGGCFSISSANLFWKLSNPSAIYDISSMTLDELKQDTTLNRIELAKNFFQEIKLNFSEKAEIDIFIHLSCDQDWSIRTESTLTPQSHYVRSRIEPDYYSQYNNYSIKSEVDVIDLIKNLSISNFDEAG